MTTSFFLKGHKKGSDKSLRAETGAEFSTRTSIFKTQEPFLEFRVGKVPILQVWRSQTRRTKRAGVAHSSFPPLNTLEYQALLNP